jgi:hypothetical protein
VFFCLLLLTAFSIPTFVCVRFPLQLAPHSIERVASFPLIARDGTAVAAVGGDAPTLALLCREYEGSRDLKGAWAPQLPSTTTSKPQTAEAAKAAARAAVKAAKRRAGTVATSIWLSRVERVMLFDTMQTTSRKFYEHVSSFVLFSFRLCDFDSTRFACFSA